MTRTAVIAGVGPGLGGSIARRFAGEGCRVALFARSPDFIEELAGDLEETVGDGLAIPTDVSDSGQVAEGFDRVREEFGPVDVLVNNASAAPWDGLLEIDHEQFHRALEVGVHGALYCAQEAVGDMLDTDGGTVIFTGATTAVRGRGGAIGFSASKFGARGMAESMARELGPDGIHVAHVVIDGQILTPAVRETYPERHQTEFLDPDDVADAYWNLVEQPRSAWTLELDLRPHVEKF